MGLARAAGQPTRAPLEPIDETLAALADPVRRMVVDRLSTGPCRAGELAAAVGVSAPTMSKHLRSLRETGIVSEEPSVLDARVRIYSLRAAPMHELRAWLDRAERGWAEQLTAFAEHVGAAELEASQ